MVGPTRAIAGERWRRFRIATVGACNGTIADVGGSLDRVDAPAGGPVTINMRNGLDIRGSHQGMPSA